MAHWNACLDIHLCASRSEQRWELCDEHFCMVMFLGSILRGNGASRNDSRLVASV